VDSSHESLINTESIINDLAQGSEAVGSARSVGNNGHVRAVSLVVDTVNESWGIILGWGSEDNLFGSSGKMSSDALLSKENSSRFAEVFSSSVSPRAVGWVSLIEDLNEKSIDNKTSISDFDGSWESSVDGIKLKKILQVLEIFSWSVDGNADSFVSLVHEGGSEDESSNSSKSVNSHLGNHSFVHMVVHLNNFGITRDSRSSEHSNVTSC